MNNEYYGVASTPTEDYLAHYGIKGMKWGVRKARESGNSRALSRQFKKAEKKLAKLEKRANNGAKYARRASRLGLGAAAAGGLAIAGTEGVSKGMRAVGTVGHKLSAKLGYGSAGNAAHKGLNTAANAIETWGKGTHDVGKSLHGGLARVGLGSQGNQVHKALNKSKFAGAQVSNNALARVGAGALGAGLAAGALYNQHRAKTTDKAAKKAAAFKKEMQKQFAGTQYANQVGAPKKRKRRR
jgi:hypothetical protein